MDLPLGETIVGRSSFCHITLDDPLVSRRHAAFRVENGRLLVKDLGSRNGILVNGSPVTGGTELVDKDRVRLGTHELVVSSVALPGGVVRRQTPPTGLKWRCGSCGHLYPSRLEECPECGTLTPREEETITGNLPVPDAGWSLQLLGDALDRAVLLERWTDLQRILDQARAMLNSQMAARDIDSRHFASLTKAATALLEGCGDARWVVWVLALHASRGVLPGPEAIRCLERLPAQALSAILVPLRELAERVPAAGGDADGQCRQMIGELVARCHAASSREPS